MMEQPPQRQLLVVAALHHTDGGLKEERAAAVSVTRAGGTRGAGRARGTVSTPLPAPSHCGPPGAPRHQSRSKQSLARRLSRVPVDGEAAALHFMGTKTLLHGLQDTSVSSCRTYMTRRRIYFISLD